MINAVVQNRTIYILHCHHLFPVRILWNVVIRFGLHKKCLHKFCDFVQNRTLPLLLVQIGAHNPVTPAVLCPELNIEPSLRNNKNGSKH